MPTRQHFRDALQEVHEEILRMGALVEEALQKALQAFEEKDIIAAEKIIAKDDEIDSAQLLIEDRCTVLLATEQPVASDLRHLITAIKIVVNLERIGDHAVHLSKTTIRLANDPYIQPIRDMIRPMADLGIEMVRDVLTALSEHSADRAKEVASRDDEIDKMHTELFNSFINFMKDNPDYALQTTDLLFLIRFLERLGDHVTHICEWIVFQETGKHMELNK
jgi:phosphate transport system protein